MNNNKLNNEEIMINLDMLRKFIEISIQGKKFNNQYSDEDEKIHQLVHINGPIKKMIDHNQLDALLDSSEFNQVLEYFQDNKLQKNSEAMEIINYLIERFPNKISVTLW